MKLEIISCPHFEGVTVVSRHAILEVWCHSYSWIFGNFIQLLVLKWAMMRKLDVIFLFFFSFIQWRLSIMKTHILWSWDISFMIYLIIPNASFFPFSFFLSFSLILSSNPFIDFWGGRCYHFLKFLSLFLFFFSYPYSHL